jgi:hypothetical protein
MVAAGLLPKKSSEDLPSRLDATKERLVERLTSTSEMDSETLRRSIDAYVGLGLALAQPVGTTGVSALLETTRHPDPLLAATCLSRSERETLLRRFQQAQHLIASTLHDLQTEAAEIEDLGQLAQDPDLVEMCSRVGNYAPIGSETVRRIAA